MRGKKDEKSVTYAVVAGNEHAAVTRDRYATNWDFVLRNELVGTLVFAQVPDSNIAALIAADQLSLVGVNDNVIDATVLSMIVVALFAAGACVPDLDSAILRAGNHPFAFAVEADTSDVALVTLEGKHRVWVG